MYYPLLLSVALASLRSLFSKHMGVKTEGNAAFLKWNSYIYLAGFFVLFIVSGGIAAISVYSAQMALLYGMLSLLSQLFYMLSMRKGPMAFCTFFYSSGFVIPAVLGAWVWHESVSLQQILGVLLLLISFAVSLSKPSGKRKEGKIWAVYAFLAMLSSGLVGFMQKVHQSSAYKGELNAFLIISFLFAAVLSFVLYFIFLSRSKNGEQKEPTSGKMLASSFLSGICIAFSNEINTFLSGRMPSMIFYPSVNGGVIILSAILAGICFREKQTKEEWLGLALGLAAIVLVSIK